MYRPMGWLLGLGLVIAACGGDSAPMKPDGEEGGHCYKNKTCNAGLTCASNLCVDPSWRSVEGPQCEEGEDCRDAGGDDGDGKESIARKDGGGPSGGEGGTGSTSAGEGGESGGGGSGAGGSAGSSAGGAGGTSAPPCTGTDCLPVPCGGDVCDHPPPSVCSDANTLQTFAFLGTCDGTSCVYSQTVTPCPSGCVAGQCQSGSQTLHPWAGVYKGTYAGLESGSLIAVVAPNGALTVYVSSPRGEEVYTGTVDPTGSLTASGTIMGTYMVAFSGSLSGEGPNRMGNGTWSVAALGSGGSWQTDEVNPWTGHYTGTFSGSLSGTLDVTVGDDGKVSVDASGMLFTGSVRIDGTLNVTGSLSGGVPVTYAGTLSGVVPNRGGSGTWSSVGLGGTWMTNED